ncbi:MAG: DUF1127 domain-containing protein [Paracoccaceae bacterium]|nr:DUF1127 domain-containing protein [Paracoccaceae bacterium]MDG2257278.1 DUF1127 domain-containing protein [Paracoccaceae bacterium]
MATFADTPVHSGLNIRFADTLKSLVARFQNNRRYRQTVNELSALSAYELADLGIHSSNIKRIAFDSTYGTNV